MHPLFDASSLSDQELLKKIDNFSSKIGIARRNHQEYQLIQQFQNIINDCVEEMQMREYAKSLKNEDPCVFDMDLYLERNKHEKEPSNIPRWKSAVLDELSNESFEPWNSTAFNDIDK